MKKIIIFCSRMNAHAGVVLDIIQQYKLYDVVGFLDDDNNLQGKKLQGIPVLGKIRNFPENIPEGIDGLFIATGNNRFRAFCYELIKKYNYCLVNVIHPSAIISDSVQLGEGIFIGANTILNNNTVIGNNVLINTAAVIEHDNVIKDHVFIGPGSRIAGRVRIKENAFLGIGVTVIPDILIGKEAIIGAGSVVIDNVEDGATVVGVPAKEKNIKEVIK